MTPDETKELLERYFAADHGDLDTLSDGVVFTDMMTGDRYVGPDGVQGMLRYIYEEAFDARAEVKHVCYGAGSAALEADFVGTQQMDFAGIPNTGMHVRAPLCVTYRCATARSRTASCTRRSFPP